MLHKKIKFYKTLANTFRFRKEFFAYLKKLEEEVEDIRRYFRIKKFKEYGQTKKTGKEAGKND